NGIDLCLATFMLALLPAIMVIRKHDFPYHYFKLLLTVCPLYALGVVVLAVQLARGMRPLVGKAAHLAIWLVVLAGFGFAVHGAWRMAWHSAEPNEVFRTNQSFALNADFLYMRANLEATRDQDILFRPAWGDRLYDQIWGMYFARHNNVWLTFPHHNDSRNVKKNPLFYHLADLTKLPPRYLVLCPNHSIYVEPPKSLPASAVLWENGTYKMWQYDGQPWACITHIENPNGSDCHNQRALWLGGGDTIIDIFATQAGSVKLPVILSNGPCIDATEKILVSINDGRGSPYVVEMAQGSLALPLTVMPGNNTLTIQVLNKKQFSAKDDPRPLLVQCYFGEIDFQPGSAQTSVPTGAHGN
ncbi:MAG TPA: hypothetical protein VE988_09255, partial [Gemmataceae bacterium]|nr:hypothetical protein [Gemmataceae bacterium]